MKFTTSFIDAALARLRNTLTLHVSRDRVSSELKRMAYKADADDKAKLDTLRHQLDTLALEDTPMDRKRAQETLATVLTGRNYALLQRDAICTDNPTPANFNAAREMLGNALSLLHDMQYYERSAKHAYAQLLKLLTEHAGDALPVHGDGITPWESSASLFAFYRDKLIAHKPTFTYTVEDAAAPLFTRSGCDKYNVKVTFAFGEHTIKLTWDVANNEYAEFDDESIDIELDGSPIEEVTRLEPCDNGKYVFDLVSDVMSDYLRENVRLADDDVKPPTDPSRNAERELTMNALLLSQNPPPQINN